MNCNQQALFRYTWAGRDESFCCIEHAQQIQGVATAMGYYVQLIPLSGDEQSKVSCQSEVREVKNDMRKIVDGNIGDFDWADGDIDGKS